MSTSLLLNHPDILCLVFSYLPDSALRSLLLTCKVLHSLAAPILYRTLSIDPTHGRYPTGIHTISGLLPRRLPYPVGNSAGLEGHTRVLELVTHDQWDHPSLDLSTPFLPHLHTLRIISDHPYLHKTGLYACTLATEPVPCPLVSSLRPRKLVLRDMANPLPALREPCRHLLEHLEELIVVVKSGGSRVGRKAYESIYTVIPPQCRVTVIMQPSEGGWRSHPPIALSLGGRCPNVLTDLAALGRFFLGNGETLVGATAINGAADRRGAEPCVIVEINGGHSIRGSGGAMDIIRGATSLDNTPGYRTPHTDTHRGAKLKVVNLGGVDTSTLDVDFSSLSTTEVAAEMEGVVRGLMGEVGDEDGMVFESLEEWETAGEWVDVFEPEEIKAWGL